ncbi:MAG TPA: YeeE/YedE thiosulfate transporter family protein [Methanolinea sp.]|nr:YeeE/YedE thiosulfate transporter family protein [Methanolinea sp.]HQK54913.1 YeeE/YedE thiosulfate transporter family protein [Methanolinea sp.]
MALEKIRSNSHVQIVLGLLIGIAFGFLLQKGEVTEYGVIIGQLLLSDFTVVKVMLSAILVGMIGVHVMKAKGLVRLHCKAGSIGATVVGGLIFGAGFAVLGYCPGTAAGAFGSGALDAAVGMAGIVIGAGLFARLFPYLERKILNKGVFPAETIPDMLGVRPAWVVVVVGIFIVGVLTVLAELGL